ncbi:MAG TPA: glycosyltransferase family 39 protein [Verrucomicrobiae bacterium]|nr:glycosyltransferase family 39 protein [Verrucomicrobiae bacterium]
MATATAPLPPGEQVDAPLSARLSNVVYPLALGAAIALWLVAVRAPFWVDETLAYWQVSGGFAKIWSRSAQMPSSLAFLYLLWLEKSLLGSREILLRLPSIAAMLAAVFFLFRAARELFSREVAFLAAILFSLHVDVLFAAIDVRPYAYALLAATVAIFAFARWIARHEIRYAVLFGAAAAGVIHFHYLFGSILLAFPIYYLMVRRNSIRADLPQIGAALAAFGVVALPLLPRFVALFSARQLHTFAGKPDNFFILRTLVPFKMLVTFVAVAFLAACVRKLRLPDRASLRRLLFCLLLMFVPIAILYGISSATRTHVFIPRYCLAAVPGAMLTWGYLASRIDSRRLRQLFCIGLVTYAAISLFRYPNHASHEISFKPAFDFVNASVAQDGAPVLVCSAFIESDYEPLPTGLDAENALVSQLTYYRVNAPVALLPISLNDQALQAGRDQVLRAAQQRQRFLALGGPASYPTLRWLANYASVAFAVREVGDFNQVVVLEFVPMSASGQ